MFTHEELEVLWYILMQYILMLYPKNCCLPNFIISSIFCDMSAKCQLQKNSAFITQFVLRQVHSLF
jgi:hypothetical protein